MYIIANQDFNKRVFLLNRETRFHMINQLSNEKPKSMFCLFLKTYFPFLIYILKFLICRKIYFYKNSIIEKVDKF